MVFLHPEKPAGQETEILFLLLTIQKIEIPAGQLATDPSPA